MVPRAVLNGDQHQNLILRKYSTDAKLKLTGYWDLWCVTPLFNVPACVLWAKRDVLTGSVDLARVRPGSGVELLRNYLQYAASNGKRLGDAEVTAEPLNPFEAEVFDSLSMAGLRLILVQLLRWIGSDGQLRTDDQIIDEMVDTLGFSRRGTRIESAIQNAITRWRPRA